MEAVLNSNLADAMKNPQVKGVVCADMQGICLGNVGEAHASLAGPIAGLCDEANKQWPSQDSPVIILDATGRDGDKSFLITMSDGICTGIIKEK